MVAVAVTGAAGSLGSALIPRLLDGDGGDGSRRDVRVVAIDRVAPRALGPGVEVRIADVRDDNLTEVLSGCDVLVHLAFIVERGSRDPQQVDAVNVGGTINTLTSAAAAGVGHIVYASSIAAYGMHPRAGGAVLDEGAPVRGNPDFYYSRTKAEVELWLDEFEARHPDLPVARLRPSAFMSGGADARSAVFRSRVLPYVSSFDGPIHITHESDVADAFALAVWRRARGAYNIATGDPLPMSAWPRVLSALGVPVPEGALALADVAYRKRWVDIDPAWLRTAPRHPIVVTSERAHRELGWQPRLPTTREALLQLSGRPTAQASVRARAVMGSLVRWTALRGRLPLPERARSALSGVNGTLNLHIDLPQGRRPGLWHVWCWEQTAGVAPGADPRATGSAWLPEVVWFGLLRGRIDVSEQVAAGRIRVRGDGARLLAAVAAAAREALPHGALSPGHAAA